MLADACLAITLRVDNLTGNSQNQHSAKEYADMSDIKVLQKKHQEKFEKRLESLLEMQYGEVTKDTDTKWKVEIADDIFIKLNTVSLEVECEEDAVMEQLISETLRRLYSAFEKLVCDGEALSERGYNSRRRFRLFQPNFGGQPICFQMRCIPQSCLSLN